MDISEKVQIAVNEMFLCRDMLEHMGCFQQYYEELKDWTFIIFSDEEGAKLPDILCTNLDNDFAVINLGCGENYYAVNKEIHKEMLSTGHSDYYIDICVELDTQAVSYLKTIFGDYNSIPDYTPIKELVHYLQAPRVNYSCIPYLVENAAKKSFINKLECYQNIKSYCIFKAFNYLKVIQGENIVFDKSIEDIQIDTDVIYNFMFSDWFAKYYGDYFSLQKSIYILLMKATCIEFTNSKRSAKNKFWELVDFVNESIGYIAERELEICYHYFLHDDRTRKFFKGVQKNSKNLCAKINGMAWDLVHIRLVEREFTTIVDDKISYAIHALLTFDNGLKDVLQINPLEKLAIYDGMAIPKLKYLWWENIEGPKEKIFGKEYKLMRKLTLAKRNLEELQRNLEVELKGLCN